MDRTILQYVDSKELKRVVGHDSTVITTYHFSSKVVFRYEVGVEGWYDLAMQLCLDYGDGAADSGGTDPGDAPGTGGRARLAAQQSGDDDDGVGSHSFDPSDWMSVTGSISFRNPYGYLPSSLFGLLPFQILLVLGYSGIIVCYLLAMIRYRDALIGLHYGVLLVLLVALGESAVWLATYVYINQQGMPFCCPYPVQVEAAYICQIIRQTLSRCLLLVISMGYGMAKESLSRWEWLGIALITAAYYLSATFGEVFDMTIKNQLPVSSYGGSAGAGDAVVDEQFVYFASVAIDSMFIVWTYNAFVTTIGILREYSQTYKLALYNRLFTSICVFVILFVAATVLLFYCNYVAFNFPWQLQWVPIVLFPTLNYSILMSAAVICIPNESSRYLTYATQLPNYDIDGGGSVGGSSVELAMVDPQLDTALDEEDIMNQEHGSVITHHMTPPTSRLMYKPTGTAGKTPTPIKLGGAASGAGRSIHTPLSKYNLKINPPSV